MADEPNLPIAQPVVPPESPMRRRRRRWRLVVTFLLVMAVLTMLHTPDNHVPLPGGQEIAYQLGQMVGQLVLVIGLTALIFWIDGLILRRREQRRGKGING